MQVKLVKGVVHATLNQRERGILRDAEAICQMLDAHGEACGEAATALRHVRMAFDPVVAPATPTDATDAPATKDGK